MKMVKETKVSSRRKSINKTLYETHKQQSLNTNLKGQPVKSSRTVVVRVADPTNPRFVDVNQKFSFPAREQDIALLKDLLSDFGLARHSVMEDIWQDFQQNEAFYIQEAQEVEYAEKHGTNISRFTTEEGEVISTPFSCQECQKPLYVHYYDPIQDKSKKPKRYYFARCIEETHKRGIKLSDKKDVNDSSKTMFDIKKFKAQPLSNHFSAKYITGSKTKNSYENCLKPFELPKIKRQWERSVGDSLRQIAARDLAGFLDKYYSVKESIQKTIEHNNKQIDSNSLKYGLSKYQVSPLNLSLLSSINGRDDIDAYNRLVSTYNTWLNETCWQHPEYGKELKEALPKLKRLKGYPSFPIIEKEQSRFQYTEEELGLKFEQLIADLEANWHVHLEQLTDGMFHNFLKRHSPRVIWKKLPEYIDDISPPKRLYLKRKDEKQKSQKQPLQFKATERIGNWLFYEYKQKNQPLKTALINTLKRIDQKIGVLKFHYQKQKQNDKENRDIQSYQQLIKWYQAKTTLLLEALHPSLDTTSEEQKTLYWEVISQAKDLYGLLRGDPFKKKLERKTFEVVGFSSSGKTGKTSLQYDAILSIYISEKNVPEYYLLLQPLKKEKKCKFLLNVDERVNLTSLSPGWYGFWKDGGNDTTVLSPMEVNFTEEAIIRLPLIFGERQGQRYLWNRIFPLASSTEMGKFRLMNARVIEQSLATDLKDERLRNKYRKQEGLYIAIAFEKVAEHGVLDDKRWQYQTILGVDRGEKIPLVARLLDLDGNPLLVDVENGQDPSMGIQIGVDHYAIQKKWAEKIKQQQKIGSAQVNVDSNRGKHVADQMINNAVAQLLDIAKSHNALIVFEDLSRGFGRRGSNTYMTLQQYTRLEDALIRKAQEVGLYPAKGDLLTNCRKGILAKVIAQHTSQTCSACGRINSKDALSKILFSTLHKTDGNYALKRPDGSLLSLKKTDLTEEIDKILKNGQSFQNLTKTARKNLVSLLNQELQYRPTQDQFQCLYCDHKAHADAQAALNIGRAWLFVREEEVKAFRDRSSLPGEAKGSQEHQQYKKQQEKTQKAKNTGRHSNDIEYYPENESEDMQGAKDINQKQVSYADFWSQFYQKRLEQKLFQ